MNLNLKSRLQIETIKRTHAGAFLQIVIATALWILFSQEKDHPPSWHIGLGLIVTFGIAQLLMFFFSSASSALKHFRIFMSVLVLGASAWGVFAALTIHNEGLYSLEGIVSVFCINVLLCGVIHALAPSPWIHRAYTSSMALPVLGSIFYGSTSSFENISGMSFLILFCYLIVAGKSISSSFRNSVELEMSLRNEKEKLQQIVDSVPGFVALSDSDSNWVEHSKSFAKISNTDPLKKLQKIFLESNTQTLTEEIEWTEKNNELSFMVSMARLEDPKAGSIMVGIPIAELKAIRQQLEIQRSNTEFNSRLATLGEMAAGIAHEINNPLAVISGNAGLLQRILSIDPVDKVRINEKLEKIITTSHRISKIVQGLRTFSRQGDKDPFMSISLPQTVQDSLELCQEKFKSHGVSLILDPVPQIELEARSVQVCQVLVNLLNNAFDALKDQDRKIIYVQFDLSPEFITIKVEDNGPGIPTMIQKKIFEPFFTTKEVGKGTGLGLSVAKGIIEDHQGEISVQSEPGITLFEIKLPLQRKNLRQKSAA